MYVCSFRLSVRGEVRPNFFPFFSTGWDRGKKAGQDFFVTRRCFGLPFSALGWSRTTFLSFFFFFGYVHGHVALVGLLGAKTPSEVTPPFLRRADDHWIGPPFFFGTVLSSTEKKN
jgi:hypothetical protein